TAATAMTEGVLAPDALAELAPDAVSPGLLALVGDDAPTRAILCAGAGHFAVANITLTEGAFIGRGDDAGARVAAEWERVTDRRDEIVPAYGFTQAERELANAGFTAPTMAVAH
ncbi:MAG: 3-hydroxyacyl-CoA dehydrogenase, partial [Alphaproteobacteria bacterium]|nr:3-hydroxyacyl-CoA dehydrogenase [Alphaproteobacteria bacterium]